MDSGWRINWQFGKYVDPDNNTYKVWMDEGLFKPRFAGQAAYFTPPIAPWHAGPAGFASTSMYTRFGLALVTAMFALPMRSAGRPAAIFVKCSPPSVDL